MTKQDIINNVKDVVKNISNEDAKKAVNATLQSIENALVRGDEVQLIGFGTFKVSDKPERKGHNPKTGEEITIPAHKAVAFKAGKAVTEKVNGK
jgi:DNA-binding protein HU-beta